MEEKRFGAKNSLLNELRLFQLMLKKKRKMSFNVTIGGTAGRRQTTILVVGNEVTIDGLPHVILKNQAIDRGSKISLILHGVMEMDVTFETLALKDNFWSKMYVCMLKQPIHF